MPGEKAKLYWDYVHELGRSFFFQYAPSNANMATGGDLPPPELQKGKTDDFVDGHYRQ